ncbi:putative glycoside hydrolase family 5 protein [Rosellinia necatrix]|uniref:Putative glycoside hydrolase family 5 protein n=1 Tax=Rosellinia necatrix TaxID=77044 RepID=A0A1W2TCD3_ROSNE|nr:putative glycoside hydrolase family 5 protein [Rosellinia necatrix]
MRASTLVWSFLLGPGCASTTPPRNPHQNAIGPHLERDSSGQEWPYAPFSTKGRDIVNNRGEAVTWAGVNWPMSGESMIPEGLEWKSAGDILDDVASVGFNYIRMGYAIQMIDEIYERGGRDVPMIEALTAALGARNGTRVARAIVARNPGWTVRTTRFELWSDIARAASARGLFVQPDVHVGRAQWCCSHTDGNAWFDDVAFPAGAWRRGLAHVAAWARQHPNVVSMSLRNELRESWNRTDLYYNWATLVGNMTAGADAIHAAHPGLLITWSGMQYGQDLSALTAGANILTAPCYRCTAIRDARRRDPVVFDAAAHPWADKLVWELHLYGGSEDLDTGDCDVIEAGLYRNGFNALGIAPNAAGCAVTGDCPPASRLAPVIFSEFGHAQDASLHGDLLQDCIRAFTIRHRVSWMMWSLAGSYRIRQGTQGLVDTWGLTSADWSSWNDPATIEGYWKPWVQSMNVTRKE